MGGLVVAGAFLAFGITGRGTTHTVIEQAPVDAELNTKPADAARDLRSATRPAWCSSRAQVVRQVQDPFELSGVAQQQSSSTGSGFLIDPRGDILTNYHVIEGADRQSGVTVQFEDNVSRRAAVVDADPNNDIAVLHVEHGRGQRPAARRSATQSESRSAIRPWRSATRSDSIAP